MQLKKTQQTLEHEGSIRSPRDNLKFLGRLHTEDDPNVCPLSFSVSGFRASSRILKQAHKHNSLEEIKKSNGTRV